MSLYPRTPAQRARIIAFGLCIDPDGPPTTGDHEPLLRGILATHEREVLQEATRLLRARLKAVEDEICRRP